MITSFRSSVAVSPATNTKRIVPVVPLQRTVNHDQPGVLNTWLQQYGVARGNKGRK